MKIDTEIFPEDVNNFLRYMSVVRNKSDLTVHEYAFDLRTFLHFMVVYKSKNFTFDLKSISDDEFEKADISALDGKFYSSVTLQDAYAYMSYCKDVRHNSAKTRARKTSSLRSFYKYLFINKIITDNPLQYLTQPKIEKTLPHYLTLEQSEQLLDSIDGPNKARNYAIVTLFLNCGLRLSELVGINVKDIRRTAAGSNLVVRGKGAKERTVYLNEVCLEAIDEYLKVRPSVGLKDDQALFISERLNRISPKTVQYTVKQFLASIGAGEGFSVHKLRHTAATLMYQQGHVDILVLKELLGHENLSTTEIYTHIQSSQVRAATDSNPLNKPKAKK